MKVSNAIFRNYDIRGVYPSEINEDLSENIGKALGTIVRRKKGRKVVVGRDNRESSPSLTKSLIKGLVSTGCNVVDVGISLTPVIHFLTCEEDFDLGIEVTASHNPKEYNGFRIDYKDATPLYGEDILEIKKLIEKENYEQGKGSLKEKDLFFKYLDYLKSKFKFDKGVKVVVDCGNGTVSKFMPKVFEEVGCEVVPMSCRIDENYPHGIPDPENKTMMKRLRDEVVNNGADLGVILDPDADRFGFVDEKGRNYDTDKTLMLFADDILKENPGAKIVFDIKSTGMLENFIKSRGGTYERIKTGHPYFTEAIKNGAALGAEFSGHVYFQDNYSGYDDGIYASCKVMEKLIEKNRPFSYLMTLYPMRVHSSEIKLPCPDNLKFGLVDTLIKNFKELSDVKEINETDGARIKVTETGWFLIRASNTSPYLSVRVEGLNEKEVGIMLDRVKTVLTPFDFVNVEALESVQIYVS